MNRGISNNTILLILSGATALALILWMAYRWWASRGWGDGYRPRDY